MENLDLMMGGEQLAEGVFIVGGADEEIRDEDDDAAMTAFEQELGDGVGDAGLRAASKAADEGTQRGVGFAPAIKRSEFELVIGAASGERGQSHGVIFAHADVGESGAEEEREAELIVALRYRHRGAGVDQ